MELKDVVLAICDLRVVVVLLEAVVLRAVVLVVLREYVVLLVALLVLVVLRSLFAEAMVLVVVLIVLVVPVSDKAAGDVVTAVVHTELPSAPPPRDNASSLGKP